MDVIHWWLVGALSKQTVIPSYTFFHFSIFDQFPHNGSLRKQIIAFDTRIYPAPFLKQMSTLLLRIENFVLRYYSKRLCDRVVSNYRLLFCSIYLLLCDKQIVLQVQLKTSFAVFQLIRFWAARYHRFSMLNFMNHHHCTKCARRQQPSNR